MTRALRSERGGILVLSAVMIPVFLLFTALVIDVGDWYTHKRQLQNRADAAAFAAGTEYAKRWKACVQTGDAALKLSTANAIADAARQYAADPEASDYSTGALPASLHNTEIANQSKLDVMINSANSNNYTDDTDFTDGGAGNVANPCFSHTSGDDVSAPGYWTDVKVKERDLPSLFGKFGRLLSRNIARARVDIRPAVSGHRFLPLAVPNNIITKVQVRYYNDCTSPATLLATRDLYPLPTPSQSGFANSGGGQLWGLEGGTPGEGDKNVSFGLALPNYSASCGDYLPVGMEVRLASRDDIDLNQSCSALIAARYADCFHRLSQIRVWNDGNPESQPRVRDVHVTGGCGAPADGYFSRLPVAANDCAFDVSADVEWGSRDDGNKNVISNFQVAANGVQLDPPSGSPSGVWSSSGGAIDFAAGANTVTLSLQWEDHNGSHDWHGQCKNGNNNPCQYSGTQSVHQAFVGTKGNAGAVALVRSGGTWDTVNNLPGQPFDNYNTGGATVQIFPTVGTVSVLRAGVLTTLRLDDPQSNQTLQCDPNVAQGQEFSAFRYGCEPWYGPNEWSSPWWIGSAGAKHCPDGGQWFSYSDLGAGFGVNSRNNPWECVLTAPGMSTGQIGDDIAVATDNCNNINNNSCQQFACNYDGNYDGKTGSTTQPWTVLSDSRYPRVVNLFIVPYQAGKGLTGAGDTIPVLGFASFYVMNWTGANSNQSDPCPDTTWGNVNVPNPPKGAITGVFVETVDYEPGPVDPTATCVEGQLTPCRVTLVR